MNTLFVGDICTTDGTEPYFASGNTKMLFADTIDIFKNRDFIFANPECTITESDNAMLPRSETFSHRYQSLSLLFDTTFKKKKKYKQILRIFITELLCYYY